jgi:hypothetical protein
MAPYTTATEVPFKAGEVASEDGGQEAHPLSQAVKDQKSLYWGKLANHSVPAPSLCGAK